MHTKPIYSMINYISVSLSTAIDYLPLETEGTTVPAGHSAELRCTAAGYVHQDDQVNAWRMRRLVERTT